MRGGEGSDLRLLLLVWSTKDKLIDDEEVDGMARVLDWMAQVLREALGKEGERKRRRRDGPRSW